MRFAWLPLLALVSAPAIAQQTAPKHSSSPDPDKQICRRVQVTGSNFGKRVCHTRAEWQAIHEADEANAQRALDRRGPGTQRGD
ncbi:hypothetical protein ACX40Y_07035 [Sphingomonas sp. RS6]